MNQLAGMSCFWKRPSNLGVPISPANIPLWMSDGESSPPYDPSHPPTASMSTPNTAMISLGTAYLSFVDCRSNLRTTVYRGRLLYQAAAAREPTGPGPATPTLQ